MFVNKAKLLSVGLAVLLHIEVLSAASSSFFTSAAETPTTLNISIETMPTEQVFAEGSVYSLNLNTIFKNNAAKALVFKDDGNLSRLGLRITAEGYIVGTFTVDKNYENFRVKITAEEQNNPDITAAIEISYTVVAQVLSSAIGEQSGVGDGSTEFMLDAAKAGNFQPREGVSYGLQGAPSSLSIDEQGVISGKLRYKAGAKNVYAVTVHAVNQLNTRANSTFQSSQTFNLYVTPSLLTAQNALLNYNNKQSLSYDLQQLVSDPNGGTLSFSVNESGASKLAAMNIQLDSSGYLSSHRVKYSLGANYFIIYVNVKSTATANLARIILEITISPMIKLSSQPFKNTFYISDPYASRESYNAAYEGLFQPFDYTNPEANDLITFSLERDFDAPFKINPIRGVVRLSYTPYSVPYFSYHLKIIAEQKANPTNRTAQVLSIQVAPY